MTAETQTVPDQHSNIVGGSTAGRRLACPASYALEQKVPEEKGNVYANEGTTLHEMMTILLLDPGKAPEDILPFTFTHKDGWTYTVDTDIWEAYGAPALDAFLDYMDKVESETGATFEYIVEKKCALPGIDGAFGTSDVIWRCGNLAGVWDWKFGYGEVKAEDNPQLKFYARAAMDAFPDMFREAAEIELAIMQPQRSDEPDVWVCYPSELEEFRVELVAAVEEALTLGEQARIARGKHCEFARCKAVCPLHINPSLELGARLAALHERRALAEAQPNADDAQHAQYALPMANEPEFADDLAHLLELAEAAGDYAKMVFALAHELAEADPEQREKLREAGWVLKDKKPGNRAWVEDETKIMRGARSRGLKIDDFAPRKLLSPKQIEDKLKKLGKEMPKTWAKSPPPSGTTLVRQDGSVKEHTPMSEKLGALADRLAHLR